MAKTSQNSQGYSLRIGILHRGRLVKETVFHGATVRAGSALSNDLVIFGAGIPEGGDIFVPQGSANWSINLGYSADAVVELDGVKKPASAWAAGGAGNQLELPANARGKVTLGDTAILFQVVDGTPAVIPVVPPKMKLGVIGFAVLMMGFSTAFVGSLIFSFVVHGGLFGLALFTPPPPRPDGDFELAARLTRMLTEVEQEDRELPEEFDEEDDTIVEETSDDTQAEERPTEREDSPRPDRSSGDPQDALTAVDQVVAASAFGALVSADGGLNLGLVALDSASERSAAEALAQQQATGGTGGVVASNLGNVGSGTGDGTGRLGIGEGGSAVADAARASDAGGSRQEQVAVRPNVSDRGNRTAGSGSLSESEVRGVLGRFSRRVERCYERVLATNPSASGRVEIQFRVGASGETEDARLPANELGDSFGNCILTEVRRLRFSAPSGGSVTVSQRYILQPGR